MSSVASTRPSALMHSGLPPDIFPPIVPAPEPERVSRTLVSARHTLSPCGPLEVMTLTDSVRRAALGSVIALWLLTGAMGCTRTSIQNEATSGTPPGEGGRVSSAEQLAESARKAGSGTGRFTLTMVALGTARGDVEAIQGEGQFDSSKRRFQTKMELTGYADLFADSAGLGGVGLDQLFGEPIEMVGDGDDVYTRASFLNTLMGGSPTTPWVRYSAKSQTGRSAGDAMGNLVPFGAAAGSGASSFVNSLQGATGAVKDLGSETIDGVQTRHLAATVDPDKLKAKGIPNQFGDQQYPVDAWIDGDGVLRRIQYEMDPSIALPTGGLGGLGDLSQLGGDAGTGPLGEKLRITVTLFDAGKPVSIEIPPEDQVSDASSIPAVSGGGGLPPVGGSRPGTSR